MRVLLSFCCSFYNFIDSMNDSEQNKSRGKPQPQYQLMLSHLSASNYFQHLRNTYRHFLRLSQQQKYQLVLSSQLYRVKEDKTTLIINYNQPTISIIVYGQVRVKSKIYHKGSYFTCEFGQEQIEFLKKTAILMLNKMHMEDFLQERQQFYNKIDIIERILPIQLLGVQKRGFNFLNQNAQIIHGKNTQIQKLNQHRKGLFVLYQGSYTILSKTGIRLSQLSSDYFGQQIIWNDSYSYDLRADSYQYSYIYIRKQILLQVLNAQMIALLKDYYDKKHKLRSQLQQNYRKNIEFTQTFLKKISTKKVKPRFTQQQAQNFRNILGQMGTRGFKPKWKRQQEQIEQQKIQRLKQKRIYIPTKVKSKYFSTIQDGTFDHNYHQILHQQQPSSSPYKPKLYLHQRAKTQLLFKRTLQSTQMNTQRLKTSNNSPKKSRQLDLSHRIKTAQDLSNSRPNPPSRKNTNTRQTWYYSNNYDRSYSLGMNNLAKMKRYQQMKKNSMLERGERHMTLEQMTKQCNKSMMQLRSIQSTTGRNKNEDPLQAMKKTLKKQSILIKKRMESNGGGPSTWR